MTHTPRHDAMPTDAMPTNAMPTDAAPTGAMRPGRSRRRLVLPVLLGVSLAAGSVAVTAGPAAAAKVSAADCEVVLDLGDSGDAPSVASGSDLKVLAVQAKQLTAGSKKVGDKKLAAAMKDLGSIYAKAAKARNTALAGVAIATSGSKFTKALAVWGSAYGSCIAASITLPPGVTVPKR